MTRTLILFISISLLAASGVAQEVNQVDANGLRQGKWTKNFESEKSQVFYTGQFKDNIRVGEWVYYHKRGGKKAVMQLSENGLKASTTLYSEKGTKLAFGNYIDEKKDSVWTYYFPNGSVNIRETWKAGLREGQELTYYGNGQISDDYVFADGLRNGPFTEYFDDGTKSRVGAYVNDEYEGLMTFYYESGRKEIEGKYLNGQRQSTWRYYNEDGTIHYQVVYRNGTEINEKKENGLFKEMAPDNTMISEMTYKDGLKNGPFVVYHTDGRKVMKKVKDPITGEESMAEVTEGNLPSMKGTYKADRLHGSVKYFNEIGKLIRTEEYVNGELQ